jgi:hypothetical protein
MNLSKTEISESRKGQLAIRETKDDRISRLSSISPEDRGAEKEEDKVQEEAKDDFQMKNTLKTKNLETKNLETKNLEAAFSAARGFEKADVYMSIPTSTTVSRKECLVTLNDALDVVQNDSTLDIKPKRRQSQINSQRLTLEERWLQGTKDPSKMRQAMFEIDMGKSCLVPLRDRTSLTRTDL